MEDKVLCDKSDLVNIADAVRSKLGVTDTYYVSELSSAIQNIQTSGITPSGTISITENGTVDVSQYANAEVNISATPSLQSKSVTYTENGTNTIAPDGGYDGLSSVDVTVDVSGGASPRLQTKTATPSTSSQSITPDDGYDGLSEVTVSGDSNLVAANIKSGVNIFGVNGSYSGQYKFSYFSGITPYSSTEIRISVDSDIADVVGVGIKATNYFEPVANNLTSCMWWNDGTANGGNLSTFNSDGSIGFTSNVFQTPIPIDGTLSDKYARLIVSLNLFWAASCTYEGFIVYKVYGS